MAPFQDGGGVCCMLDCTAMPRGGREGRREGGREEGEEGEGGREGGGREGGNQ